MDLSVHRFSELFTQLGLPSDNDGIQQFLTAHAPLPDSIALAEAPFWTPSQAAFLGEEITRDADWAELVDQLDASLRARPLTAHERRLSVIAAST